MAVLVHVREVAVPPVDGVEDNRPRPLAFRVPCRVEEVSVLIGYLPLSPGLSVRAFVGGGLSAHSYGTPAETGLFWIGACGGGRLYSIVRHLLHVLSAARNSF